MTKFFANLSASGQLFLEELFVWCQVFDIGGKNDQFRLDQQRPKGTWHFIISSCGFEEMYPLLAELWGPAIYLEAQRGGIETTQNPTLVRQWSASWKRRDDGPGTGFERCSWYLNIRLVKLIHLCHTEAGQLFFHCSCIFLRAFEPIVEMHKNGIFFGDTNTPSTNSIDYVSLDSRHAAVTRW